MGWRTTIFLLFAPCPASVIPAKSHPYCPSFCAAVPWTARVDSGVVGAAEPLSSGKVSKVENPQIGTDRGGL